MVIIDRIFSRWRTNNANANANDNCQTKITPGHKSPHYYKKTEPTLDPQITITPLPLLAFSARATVHADNANDSHDRMRTMHPHVGTNPFFNGSTYLNDIIVQNSMLRGESVRDGGGGGINK